MAEVVPGRAAAGGQVTAQAERFVAAPGDEPEDTDADERADHGEEGRDRADGAAEIDRPDEAGQTSQQRAVVVERVALQLEAVADVAEQKRRHEPEGEGGCQREHGRNHEDAAGGKETSDEIHLKLPFLSVSRVVFAFPSRKPGRALTKNLGSS